MKCTINAPLFPLLIFLASFATICNCVKNVKGKYGIDEDEILKKLMEVDAYRGFTKQQKYHVYNLAKNYNITTSDTLKQLVGNRNDNFKTIDDWLDKLKQQQQLVDSLTPAAQRNTSNELKSTTGSSFLRQTSSTASGLNAENFYNVPQNPHSSSFAFSSSFYSLFGLEEPQKNTFESLFKSKKG